MLEVKSERSKHGRGQGRQETRETGYKGEGKKRRGGRK
jgi:hypothetical protein